MQSLSRKALLVFLALLVLDLLVRLWASRGTSGPVGVENLTMDPDQVSALEILAGKERLILERTPQGFERIDNKSKELIKSREPSTSSQEKEGNVTSREPLTAAEKQGVDVTLRTLVLHTDSGGGGLFEAYLFHGPGTGRGDCRGKPIGLWPRSGSWGFYPAILAENRPIPATFHGRVRHIPSLERDVRVCLVFRYTRSIQGLKNLQGECSYPSSQCVSVVYTSFDHVSST